MIEEVGKYLAAHSDSFSEAAEPKPLKSTALAEFEALEARREALADLYSAGEVDPRDYVLSTKQIREKQAALHVPTETADVPPKVRNLTSSKEVAKAWEELAAEDPTEAREVLKVLGFEVWVYPTSYAVDPEDGIELPPTKVAYTFSPIFVDKLTDPVKLDKTKAKAVSARLVKR